MADIAANTYVNDITKVPKNSVKIEVDHTVDNLTGDLTIKGFPNLTEIILKKHGLTSLIIEDCSQLTEVNVSDNGNLKKADFEKTVIGGDGKNLIEVVKISGEQKGFEELNLKKCFKLEELVVNDLGEVKKVMGMEDFDVSIKSINMDGSSGFSLTTTSELKELKDVKGVNDQITGGGGLPMKNDPADPSKKVVDVDALKGKIIEKATANIARELGLPVGALEQQILAKIKELKNKPDSPDADRPITKKSLAENTENDLKNWISDSELKKLSAATSAREVSQISNKLINNKFTELQSKLNTAKYLNIGLGTLAVGICLILIWMILRDKKLLPEQEEEKVKE